VLEPRSQGVERLLDVAGDLEGVPRWLLLDDQEQARPGAPGLAVGPGDGDHRVADRRREAELDVGHVAELERDAAADRHGRPGAAGSSTSPAASIPSATASSTTRRS